MKDETASYDASTPVSYENYNSGIIGFTEDGSGILTSFGVQRYNNLIKDYRVRMKVNKGVELQQNAGITEHVDKHKNVLSKIDPQHFVYYGIMNSWRKDGVEPDSLWDKAKDFVK